MNESKDYEWKTRRLSSAGKILLSKIIPALSALKAGQVLLIEDSPQRIDQIRSHLYTYFSETAQKNHFRTIRESATSLRVICKDLTLSTLTTNFSPVEDFVRSHLLSCQTHEEARLACLQAHASGKLTDETLMEVLEEWRKKCSLPQTSSKPKPKPNPHLSPSLFSDNPYFVPNGKTSSQTDKASIDPLNGTIEKPKAEKEEENG